MINRIITALIAGLLVFATPAPAHAAPPASACPTNTICLFNEATSTEPMYVWDPPDAPVNSCLPLGSAATSYIRNRTNYRWIVSSSTDCALGRGTIYPHSEGGMGSWSNQIRGRFRTSSTSR